jgi:hypothetical protein
VDQTAFRVEMTDGRVLRSADLVGAVLGVRLHGSEARIRVDSVSPDLFDRTVLLHSISVEQADGSWHPLCGRAPDGSRAGFPLSGRSTPDGSLQPARSGEIEIVCTAGAQGKCVRLGYHPWLKNMLPLFNACVRMMRADYAGNGRAETKDGTIIHVFDRLGIHPIKEGDRPAFEAGWDEHGAVCVRHPRVAGLASLGQIAASSPRLGRRVGPMCTPDEALALGALVFDSSRV